MSAAEQGPGPCSVDILIPVFNEAGNIERTLDALAAGLRGIDQNRISARVTVIYDHPEDTTLPVLQRIGRNYPFEIRRLHNPNPGVLGALKEGILRSDRDFLLVTMADMSDDYASLGPMFEHALAGADVVCGSRYMPGGKLHGGPLLKQGLSRVAGLSLHALVGFPSHDITNNYKLYRRSAVAALTLESQGGFELAMEIAIRVHLAGGRVEEVPTQWWDRTAGESHFRLGKWLPRNLGWFAMALATHRPSSCRQPGRRWLIGAVLAAILVAAVLLSVSPLSAPLTDVHGFRQTQTAITVWRMASEGMHLAYPTPVLGKPWSIPMEFPLYQWTVTLLLRISGLSLEAAGRLVSLACFWVAMVLLFRILEARVPDRASRLFLVCMVAVSPIYLFWPHTFLIETMSMALCLAFVALFQQGVRGGGRGWLLAATAAGCLAAVVKVTSMPVYDLLALLIWFCERFRFRPGGRPRPPARIGWILACFALPLASALLWTAYSDAIKAANPLAGPFLTSAALTSWNFGTLAQRSSWFVWRTVLRYTQVFSHYWLDSLLGFSVPIIPAILGVAWWMGRSRRLEMLATLLLFFVNPMIFIRLHFIHAYYSIPSAFLLSLTLGFAALSLLEADDRRVRIDGVLVAGCLLASLFTNYWLGYRRTQMAPPPYPAMAMAIQRRVAPDGVILIYGRDWDSTLPFAARRCAIMDRWWLPLDSPRFQASIRATGKDSVRAMILPETASQAFVRARCQFFGFGPKPATLVGGEALYTR
jgi:hypothetical protein